MDREQLRRANSHLSKEIHRFCFVRNLLIFCSPNSLASCWRRWIVHYWFLFIHILQLMNTPGIIIRSNLIVSTEMIIKNHSFMCHARFWGSVLPHRIKETNPEERADMSTSNFVLVVILPIFLPNSMGFRDENTVDSLFS